MKIPSATVTRKLAIVPFILLGTVSTSGPAAQQQKTKIYVQYSQNDLLGLRFAFALKENINRSSSYQLTDASDQGLRVSLMSKDVGQDIDGRAGILTAVSVMLVMDTTSTCSNVLSQGVYFFRTDRVNDMAQTLLADIDYALNLCGKTPLSACQLRGPL